VTGSSSRVMLEKLNKLQFWPTPATLTGQYTITWLWMLKYCVHNRFSYRRLKFHVVWLTLPEVSFRTAANLIKFSHNFCSNVTLHEVLVVKISSPNSSWFRLRRSLFVSLPFCVNRSLNLLKVCFTNFYIKEICRIKNGTVNPEPKRVINGGFKYGFWYNVVQQQVRIVFKVKVLFIDFPGGSLNLFFHHCLSFTRILVRIQVHRYRHSFVRNTP